jgi:hypothetical protein
MSAAPRFVSFTSHPSLLGKWVARGLALLHYYYSQYYYYFHYYYN